jgi:ribosomal protein S18 acetylase RimI-like enzyme
VIEITAEPHTGCGKFVERFGPASVKFVNSPVGMGLHLRGVNAKVLSPGRIRVGDAVTKWQPAIEIHRIRAEDTRPLRQSVLRPTQTIEELVFSSDRDPRSVHLGAFLDGRLAGIATIGPSSCPGDDTERAWQLQGMAVVPGAQRRGCGRLLLEHGIRYVVDHGGELLWCEGRTGAAGFYKALGFELVGEEFIKPLTGPHYIMKRRC